MRQPPAFQCYASDWLAKEEFRLMSLAERGLLFTMLCQAWVSRSLPTRPQELARLLGVEVNEVSESLTSHVLKAFRRTPDDRLACPELDELRVAYETKRGERAKSGKKGARARWGEAAGEKAQPMAQPSTSAMTTPEMRGDELSRHEGRGNASTGKAVDTPASDRWVQEYESVEKSAEEYRRATRGH
jgi:hypothetical protein